MPVTDGSGVPIHYDLAGSGPPLVLLHGFVGDCTTWRHAGYVDALASQFTLVLVDGRGRGRGAKPEDPAMYATRHLAADVLAVLDDLGMDSAGFWGQSLGGRVGLLLAIRHPDRLRTLIVGATRAQAATVDPASIEAEVRSIREQGMTAVVADLEATGPLPEWLRPVIPAADPAAVAACYVAMLDWPGVLEELQRIQVPTLVLAGDQDLGLADRRATADSNPGARLTVVLVQAEWSARAGTADARVDRSPVPEGTWRPRWAAGVPSGRRRRRVALLRPGLLRDQGHAAPRRHQAAADVSLRTDRPMAGKP